MYAYAHRPHRLVDENVIGSQYRKSRWERANGWRRLNESAYIAQMMIKCAPDTIQHFAGKIRSPFSIGAILFPFTRGGSNRWPLVQKKVSSPTL